jgi:hypothetical protein
MHDLGLAPLKDALAKRDIPALVEALRIRATAITGQAWERWATGIVMKEAAQQLEDLNQNHAALLDERKRLRTELSELSEETRRFRDALEEINAYPNLQHYPPTNGSGPYGIGIADGHRCAAAIARAVLYPGLKETP